MTIHSFFNNNGGVNLQTTMGSLENNEAEEITNLHLSGDGSWTSRNIGYKKLSATGLNLGQSITGMIHYKDGAEKLHTVVIAGDKAYEFNTQTGLGTEIGYSFTANARASFTLFQNLLIIANGKNPPRKWSGLGAIMNLEGWPPSVAGYTPGYPSISEVFANRLVFSGDATNPSAIYLSELENPQNFTPTTGPNSPGIIQVSPGDGEKITGLKTLYLPLDNEAVLVIFKENSIFMLTGNDADTFKVQRITSGVGAASHHSIITLGNDLIFLNQQGVSLLSTATLQGSLSSGSISKNITPQFTTLNVDELGKSFAMHLPWRHEIWWFVPEAGSPQNQLVLVYNYRNGNGVWSRRRGISATCATLMNQNLITGDHAGQVYVQLNSNSYNGTPLSWTYRTPFYLLGNPLRRKRVREVEIITTQLANTTFTVNAAWDNRRAAKNRQNRSVAVTLNSDSTLYLSAYYGVEHYDTAGTSRGRITLDGSGTSLQLEFTGTQTVNPVELQGWSILTIDGGI